MALGFESLISAAIDHRRSEKHMVWLISWLWWVWLTLLRNKNILMNILEFHFRLLVIYMSIPLVSILACFLVTLRYVTCSQMARRRNTSFVLFQNPGIRDFFRDPFSSRCDLQWRHHCGLFRSALRIGIVTHSNEHTWLFQLFYSKVNRMHPDLEQQCRKYWLKCSFCIISSNSFRHKSQHKIRNVACYLTIRLWARGFCEVIVDETEGRIIEIESKQSNFFSRIPI